MIYKNLSKIYIIAFCILTFSYGCKKESPSSFQEEEYFKLFGYAYDDVAVDMVSFDDYHYLIGNIRKSLDSDKRSVLIIKTDVFGNKIWEKFIEKSNSLIASQIIKLNDNSGLAFIATYSTDEDTFFEDFYFQKITTDGDTAEAVIYNHPLVETGKCLGEFSNGNFVLLGEHSDSITINNTYKLSIAIDKDGTLLKYGDLYNGAPSQKINTMSYASNRDLFLVVGSGPNAIGTALTFTVDNLGTYSNTYYYDVSGEFTAVHIEPEVGVFACGNLTSNGIATGNSFISSIDPFNGGSFLWSTAIEGESNSISFHENSLYLTGTYTESQQNTDIAFSKVNPVGDIEFTHTIGGDDFDYGVAGYPDKNGFLLLGTTSRGNSSLLSLIKTNFPSQ